MRGASDSREESLDGGGESRIGLAEGWKYEYYHTYLKVGTFMFASRLRFTEDQGSEANSSCLSFGYIR